MLIVQILEEVDGYVNGNFRGLPTDYISETEIREIFENVLRDHLGYRRKKENESRLLDVCEREKIAEKPKTHIIGCPHYKPSSPVYTECGHCGIVIKGEE